VDWAGEGQRWTAVASRRRRKRRRRRRRKRRRMRRRREGEKKKTKLLYHAAHDVCWHLTWSQIMGQGCPATWVLEAALQAALRQRPGIDKIKYFLFI